MAVRTTVLDDDTGVETTVITESTGDGKATVVTTIMITSVNGHGLRSADMRVLEERFGLVMPRPAPAASEAEGRPAPTAAPAQRGPELAAVEGGGPEVVAGPPPSRTRHKRPSDDELREAYDQCGGKVSCLADHFGVPTHTVGGWLHRARKAGAIPHSQRSASFGQQTIT